MAARIRTSDNQILKVRLGHLSETIVDRGDGSPISIDVKHEKGRWRFEGAVEDRARVQRGAARTGTPQDICFFVRTTLASLLSLPQGRAASVLRTLMFGPGT
jgi:hypothetical protein